MFATPVSSALLFNYTARYHTVHICLHLKKCVLGFHDTLKYMSFFNNIIHFCRAGHFNKDQMSEFSFENENQPVCSSVSSCLTSSIFMSSLSSLINTIFIIVSRGSQSLLQEFFCVFGHFVLFKMRIINRKINKCKLNLWVRLSQLSSSVVSALLRESFRVRDNVFK